MSRTRMSAVAALGVLLGAGLLAACGGTGQIGGTAGASSSAAASPPAILNINWGTEPPGLNSITATDSVSFDVLNQVMEGLTRLDAQGSPAPGIAATWDMSKDGLTYTFHLRDAQWSNGDPVTAADFVYAWQQALDPRNGAQYAYQLQYIRGAGPLLGLQVPDAQKDPAGHATAVKQINDLEAALGLKAPDDHTLVVTLAKPTPYWLGLTALPTYFPADEAKVAAWGMAKYGSDIPYMVFDGPFTVSAWMHKSSLDLKKNPKYWDAAHVRLDGVHGVMVADAGTVDDLYKTGKLDAIIPDIDPSYLSEYQGQPGFESSAVSSTWFLEFNTQDRVFGNVLVRKAFSEAIDRTAFATHVVPGNTAAFAYTPPTIHYAPGRAFTALVGKVLPVSADPAQAKADLAAGLKQMGVAALPSVVLLSGNTTGMKLESAALQGMLRDNLGITVNVQDVDFKTYLAEMRQGQFSVLLSGWNADYDDPTTFLDLWTTGGPFNAGEWSDKAYDGDMAAAQTAVDLDKRGADLAAAEQELLAQLPIVPIYWQTRNWIAKPNVSGLVFYPTGPDYSLKGVAKT